MRNFSQEPFKLVLLLLMGLISLTALHAAADCDEALKKMTTRHLRGTTLCELQARYKAASEKLKLAGIQNPDHIGNVFATRFIGKKTWAAKLAENGDAQHTARFTFRPAPTTWENWAKASDIVKNPKTPKVFLEGSTEDIKSWIRSLHTVETNQILPPERVGKFRSDVAEIIPLWSVSNAYTSAEILRVAQTPFRSAKTGSRLMSFKPRPCIDLPETAKKVNLFYFKISNSEPTKSCGDLTMAPADEVDEQMSLWASYVKRGFQDLAKNPRSRDLLSFASRAQQWLIVVHPFIDGNGRTSRFMIDLILDQLHLPPPVLDDMDRDFFATSNEWAGLIGKGIVNSVVALEACAQNPSVLGCQVISGPIPFSMGTQP